MSEECKNGLRWSLRGIALGLCAAIAPFATAQHDAAPAGPQAAASRRVSDGLPASLKQPERAREGSQLAEEVGSFEFVGDRVAFVPAGSRDSFRVLENLALERIVRELGDGRTQQAWIVNGTWTEFKGANYLLVTKAVVKTMPNGATP